MKKAILTGMLLVATCASWANTIWQLDFHERGETKTWNRKENTQVSVTTDSPKEGRAALRFEVETSQWTYGWINCRLADVDYAQAAGVHGWYRTSPSEATGKVTCTIVVNRENKQPSYFIADLGTISGETTQWTEFYVPYSAFKHHRGDIKVLAPSTFTTSDRLQFMTHTQSNKRVIVDLDGVAFIGAKEAKAIGERFERRRQLAQLQPVRQKEWQPHPRLFLTDENVARMREKAQSDKVYGTAWQRLVEMAEGELKNYDADDPMGPVFEYVEKNKETKDRRAFAGGFEGALNRQSEPMKILAAAYRLTGDRRFGQHGAKALYNAARRFNVDVEFQDLGFYYTRTMYVRNMAFAYDWLYDLLTPEQRQVVQLTLLGYVENIYEGSKTHGWGNHPLRRVWNWDPGLVGACGVAMLALEGETALQEESILFTCRRHMRDYLTLGIGPDGSGNEGPAYIGYGIGTGVEYVDLLRRRGLDDLFTGTNYGIIAPWLVSEILPDRQRWNNLSDCGHNTRPWPVYIYALARLGELAKSDPRTDADRWPTPDSVRALHYLAHFSEVPGAKRISYGAHAALLGWAWENGVGRASPVDFSFDSLIAWLIYQPEIAASDNPADILPLGMYFRGRGLVVLRTGFDTDDIYMAVEAGPYAAGHDQSDKGTFNLFGYGADLAIDSGYGNDGDPLKSGSSFAHNVVLIDGKGQPMRHHNQSSGYVSGFRHGPAADWVRVDARDAWGIRYLGDYVPERTWPVERAERQFVFVRPAEGVPPYLVVLDDIQKDERTRDYTWQWHIPASMQFVDEGERMVSAAVSQDLGTALGSSLADADGVTDPQAGGSATFTFQLDKPGQYRLAGLTRAAGAEAGKSDSFFVTVEDGEEILWDTGGQRAFQWTMVQHRGDAEPRTFDLQAGPVRVIVKKREPEAQIAKLALVPAADEKMLAKLISGKIETVLKASQAVMNDPPLRAFDLTEETGSDASLAVWPVHPKGGKVEEEWYETSRQGLHPRLHYTVRAVNPRFVFMLLPRREGVPEPTKVEPLAEGGRGVRVEWPSGAVDRIYFGGSGEGQGAGGIATDASAAMVRTVGGGVSQWAMYDGTTLEFEGNRLAEMPERRNAMSSD